MTSPTLAMIEAPKAMIFARAAGSSAAHCPAAVERLARRFWFCPMKPFLNVLREFGEIHLRDSRFSFKLNPIRFYAAHRRIFVYLPADSFEVLSKRE